MITQVPSLSVYCRNTNNSFSSLPLEVISSIFVLLDLQTLSTICLTNHHFRKLHEGHWKSICYRDFSEALMHLFPKPENLPWKTYYIRIAYPGKSGVFKMESGKDWISTKTIAPICRQLTYVSETKGSLIKALKVIGYEFGTLSIKVEISSDDRKKVCNYFSKLCAESIIHVDSSVYFTSRNSVEKLIKVFKVFNQIGNESIKQIENICRDADWKLINPFTYAE